MSIDASKLVTQEVSTRKTYPPNEELKFGQFFTDHMLRCEWNAETGWGIPEIKPYEDIRINPAAGVLHYAFSCFEGQKAFVDAEGHVRIFRPEQNIRRLNRSAARLLLPQVDENQAIELLKKFTLVEKDVIPTGRGVALYLRPTIIGTSTSLGVRPQTNAIFYIIACPVGGYAGKAMKLLATDDAVRAWPGGTGNAKLGVNYSPCMPLEQAAVSQGYDQNLWLFDGKITEVGMMNFFMLFDNKETGKKELATYPLDGLILEGITRASVLELTRERLPKDQYDVVERKVSITEFIERYKKGELLEAFGVGTAAIVMPVKEVGYHGEIVRLPNDGLPGKLGTDIKKWLQDIQYGEDDHIFCKRID